MRRGDGHGSSSSYNLTNRHTRHKLVLQKQLHTPTVRKGGSDLRNHGRKRARGKSA